MYIETKISLSLFLSLSFFLLSTPFICNPNAFSYMSLSYILLDRKIQLQISRAKLVWRSHYIHTLKNGFTKDFIIIVNFIEQLYCFLFLFFKYIFIVDIYTILCITHAINRSNQLIYALTLILDSFVIYVLQDPIHSWYRTFCFSPLLHCSSFFPIVPPRQNFPTQHRHHVTLLFLLPPSIYPHTRA